MMFFKRIRTLARDVERLQALVNETEELHKAAVASYDRRLKNVVDAKARVDRELAEARAELQSVTERHDRLTERFASASQERDEHKSRAKRLEDEVVRYLDAIPGRKGYAAARKRLSQAL